MNEGIPNKKFWKIKKEIRILGVDDGPFTPHGKEKVLITGIKKNNLYTARTQQNAPDIDDYLLISSEKDLIAGNFYDIKI